MMVWGDQWGVKWPASVEDYGSKWRWEYTSTWRKRYIMYSNYMTLFLLEHVISAV